MKILRMNTLRSAGKNCLEVLLREKGKTYRNCASLQIRGKRPYAVFATTDVKRFSFSRIAKLIETHSHTLGSLVKSHKDCINLSSCLRTYGTMGEEIDKKSLDKLLTPELKQLINVFEESGFEIRIVGGAVRDLLLGKDTPKDVDLSTNATPDEMMKVLSTHGIKYIETGLQHGTITAHLNGIDFEVTTLRIDVETDGRHATVQFTKSWELDAERRDLTFNAMSLSADGKIYDYFKGIDDLRQRQVKFVGNPRTRIAEDYLRILRYFRFYGRIAPEDGQHDTETLNIISSMASGLRNVAVERIWLEVSKILTGNHAPHLLSLMYKLGVAGEIGLPAVSEEQLANFGIIWTYMFSHSPTPVTLLVALVSSVNEAENLMRHWKLSNAERALGKFIATYRTIPADSPIKAYQDILVNVSNLKQMEITRSHVIELLHYKGRADDATEIKDWIVPSFPVSGSDLKEIGVKQGPALGKALKLLKEAWVDSYYTLSKMELLEQARRNLQTT